MAQSEQQQQQQQQLARELHRAVIKKFKTRKIIVKGIDDIWACDLLIMSAFSRQNDGYKYILNVIDCFSKYAWSVTLKQKNATDISEAFAKILKKSKRKLNLLHADMGKEFVNSTFEKLLRKQGIRMYHTYTEVKSSIVKRFNRTINEKLKIFFQLNQNRQWIDVLLRILWDYNQKNVHSTTGYPR